MEEGEEFKSIALIISDIEQELLRCAEKAEEDKQKHKEVEQDIEEQFAKCESALAARKYFLLDECSNLLSKQGMNSFQ